MKIKRIAQLCRQSGCIILFEGQDGVQWISNGSAVYPLYGLPRFGPENICTLFDITVKQSEKINIRHEKLPESFCFSDTDPNETLINSFDLDLSIGGHILMPYRTGTGVHFIEARYLAPLQDLQENLEIYERISGAGSTYFAVKSGLMIYGIILPYDFISEATVSSLKALYYECEVALANKNSKKLRDSEETDDIYLFKWERDDNG